MPCFRTIYLPIYRGVDRGIYRIKKPTKKANRTQTSGTISFTKIPIRQRTSPRITKRKIKAVKVGRRRFEGFEGIRGQGSEKKRDERGTVERVEKEMGITESESSVPYLKAILCLCHMRQPWPYLEL